MPLYEYECKQCHRRTEKIQRFSDPEVTVCPHCGGVLERLLSAPAIQFKGAGWYITDYAKSGNKAGVSGSTSSESKSSATESSAPASSDSGNTAGSSAASASAAPSSAPAPSSSNTGSSSTTK